MRRYGPPEWVVMGVMVGWTLFLLVSFVGWTLFLLGLAVWAIWW